MDEDWELLVSFLPSEWRELAPKRCAEGAAQRQSVDNLLRTLLIHLGCGHSLRETVVRARQANLADLSDVALLKRLRKSKDWLYALCVRLFQEHGIAVATGDGFQIRAFDATNVKEPGRPERCGASTTASACRRWRATSSSSRVRRGPGTGESLAQFPDSRWRSCAGRQGLLDSARHRPCGGRWRSAHRARQHRCAAAAYPVRRAIRPARRRHPAEAAPASPSRGPRQVVVGGDTAPPSRAVAPLCPAQVCAAIKLAHRFRKEATRKGKQPQPDTLDSPSM